MLLVQKGWSQSFDFMYKNQGNPKIHNDNNSKQQVNLAQKDETFAFISTTKIY